MDTVTWIGKDGRNDMKNKILFACGTTLLLISASLVASDVLIVGTLQSSDGSDLAGTIAVITGAPDITVSNHQVEGGFEIEADSTRGLIVHARSNGRPTDEASIPAGSSGTVALDFTLPEGRSVKGRVVNSTGNGVQGAAIRVRYHEPEKPLR